MSTAKRPKKRLKKDRQLVEAISQEVAPITPGEELNSAQRQERDTRMLKDKLTGSTFKELAEKYDLNISTIVHVAKRDDWAGVRKELRARQMLVLMEDLEDMAVSVQGGLKEDILMVLKDVAEKKRTFTKDERDHFRHLHDRALKEMRLDQGKPTEITDVGPATVRLILPAGAKRFGVIPPDPKVVTMVTADEDDKPVIDIESLESDVKGKVK